MRLAIPHPCIGSRESVFNMSRSSVPWRRSVDGGILFLLAFDNRLNVAPVECQGKQNQHVYRRLCAAARGCILSETAGGSDGSHKSIGVGGGCGAILRVACRRASFLCRGVRRGQNRDLEGNYLESRLGQSAYLRLSGREGRRRKDDHLGAAVAASAVLQRQWVNQGCAAEQ